MPYLIDGHNLIPKVPGLRLDDPDDEEQLIGWLQSFARVRRQKVEVYFDQAAPGHTGARQYGRVTAHFVSTAQTADDAIRLRLKRLGKSARNWTVVSSDHRVQAEARSAQSKVVAAGAFADLLVDTLRAPGDETDSESAGLSQAEVQAWLEVFRRGKDER